MEVIMNFTDPTVQSQIKEKFLAKDLLVTFTKVNGEQRKMRCTLNPTKITRQQQKESKNSRVVPSSVMVVFDLDKNEWRSFRWGSVKEISEVVL